MYLRTLVSCLFLLTISLSLQSQSIEETFERDISSFMEGTANGDFEAVLDMTYPKLFSLVSRDQMQEILASMLNNPEMKMSIKVEGIEKVHESHVEGIETFRRIDYNSAMRMKLGDETWKQKEGMVMGMKGAYPSAEVTTEDESQTVLINQVSSMIAIQEEGATEWKYLQFQANQLAMLKSLIPESIVTKMFETE